MYHTQITAVEDVNDNLTSYINLLPVYLQHHFSVLHGTDYIVQLKSCTEVDASS